LVLFSGYIISSEVYYFKEKQEVDLYIRSDREQLVNVSYGTEDEKTLKREINALKEGMRYFKIDRAYLVTAERDEIIEVDEGVIEVLPMWKWLLQ